MTHTLKVVLADQVRHRRRQLHRRLSLKEGMIAFLIGTPIISVIGIVVMKERCLAANGARRIFAGPVSLMIGGSKLMFTNTALIFLVTEFILAIFIKFLGVASWATNWYNSIHEILFSFLCFQGGIGFGDETIIP